MFAVHDVVHERSDVLSHVIFQSGISAAEAVQQKLFCPCYCSDLGAERRQLLSRLVEAATARADRVITSTCRDTA